MSTNSQNILIVDDEPNLNFTLRETLENEGYKVQIAESGKLALEKLNNFIPDLMILGVMLPGMNGFDVCKQIRDRKLTFPIIMATVRNQEIDKVTALYIGADDYITKPFGVKELLTRIHARLRRSDEYNERCTDNLDLGTTKLDLNSAVVRRPDGVFALTTREVEMLGYLVRFPNEPVSRKALLEHVWRYHYSTNTRTVDVHISKLRSKIEMHPGDPKYLVTLHGVGYMLKVK